MNKNYLLCVICIALATSCTDLPDNASVPAAPVATPTPENYSLYTDSDLQIYANTIDVKIQEALKNNNTNQAQELGRKRQELIAEFNRRGLKRTPIAPTPRSRYSRTLKHSSRPLKHSGIGLPGEN